MFEKTCIVKGCTHYPCFGYGLPSWKIPMRFACADHRDKLGPTNEVSPPVGLKAGGGGVGRRTPSAAPSPDLFGGR